MTSFTYKIYEGFPSDEILKNLTTINQAIFAFGETEEDLSIALQVRQKILICLAFHETKIIGFKLGYQERPQCFESWRGGVLPKYRGQRIATELLNRQHKWCAQQGFKIVTTTTSSQNNSMLIVNLRGGFQIVETFLNRRKIMKVVLQKKLTSPLE